MKILKLELKYDNFNQNDKNKFSKCQTKPRIRNRNQRSELKNQIIRTFYYQSEERTIERKCFFFDPNGRMQ